MRKIVLTTFGSLGDLHPYMALGVELQRRGHQVTLVTPALYEARVKAYGLAFAPMGPEDMSPEDPKLTALAFHPTRGMRYLHEKIVFPHLRRGYDELSAICQGKDLLVSGSLSYVSPLVAAKHGIPWISSLLQPMALMSRQEPLVPPFLPWIRHYDWFGPKARDVFIKAYLRGTRSWQTPLSDLRRGLGLPPDPRPFPDWLISPALNLSMFSSVFAPVQLDWPGSNQVTGFIFSDKRQPGDQTDSALLDFMRAGPPPVVFTLGSAAVTIAGNFYDVAHAVAQKLGVRAVLLAGKGAAALKAKVQSPDVFVQDYAPYSEVLPLASVVVHQCGIGTCAQTLRAGKPTLAVPFGVDQFDNAARLERFGVGRFLPIGKFSELRATKALASLLADQGAAEKARSMGQALSAEDGLRSAADAIESQAFGLASQSMVGPPGRR